MASEREVLSPVDYTIFGAMLLVSSLIGIYYAYRDKKSKAGTEGYLMANRSMGVIPVAVSLTVSFQSAITTLGVPADVYLYGICYIWIIVGMALACLVGAIIFLPVVYNLGISSVYEYLEKRYNKALRLFTSAFYIVRTLPLSAINIYGPALALSGVTGFGLTEAMLSTGLVCIFYTTLGGLRGVIWTDVFQGIIMAIGLFAVLIQGTIKVGGVEEVWRIAREGGRANIARFDTDPRIRYTAWTGIVGGFIFWLGVFGTNQAQVQRLLSVKSQTNSLKAMCLGAAGIILYTATAVLCGIVIYAYYSDCDPLSTGCITKRDELLPYAVVEFFRDHNGMPGVFLACVFSSSLSSVSSSLNAMVTLTVEDFVKPHTKWTDRQYTTLSKVLGIVFGAIALGVSFLASVVQSVVQFGIASASAFLGPTLGMFLLGIWCPSVNTTGAICGYLSGIALAVVMIVGSFSTTLPSYLDLKLDVSTKSCPSNCGYIDGPNVTFFGEEVTQLYTEEHTELTGIQNLYAISYVYIAASGFAATLLVGVIASLISGGWKQRKAVETNLLQPPFEAKVFRRIPENVRKVLRCGISWEPRQTSDSKNAELKQLADTKEEIPNSDNDNNLV